jgi:hypothetical protein
MIDHFANGLLSALEWLKKWEDHAYIESSNNGTDAKTTQDFRSALLEGIGAVANQCKKLQLLVSEALCNRLHGKLTAGEYHWKIVESELEGIRLSMNNELVSKKFAFIPIDKAEFFEQEKLLGQSVYDAFSEARYDVKEAGNALAADLNTAAVFHLMRIAEFGLRGLARQLKVKLPFQIEYATWGQVIPEIDKHIAAAKKRPRSSAKERKLQYYAELLLQIRAFADLWRNPVMHSRSRYGAEEARKVLEHVKVFLQKLAEEKLRKGVSS